MTFGHKHVNTRERAISSKRAGRTAYDSGDHLHPDDAGYMAMGAAVKLAELEITVPPGQAGPVMRSVSPDPASTGQQVTITGSGFGATQGSGYVSFSNMGTYWGAPGNAATFQVDSWSGRAITFTVPQPRGPDGVWQIAAEPPGKSVALRGGHLLYSR